MPARVRVSLVFGSLNLSGTTHGRLRVSDRTQRSVSSAAPAESGRSPPHRLPVLPSDRMRRRAGCRPAPRSLGSGRISPHAKPALIGRTDHVPQTHLTSTNSFVLAAPLQLAFCHLRESQYSCADSKVHGSTLGATDEDRFPRKDAARYSTIRRSGA
jgi:hypothetical protein